MKLLGIDVCTPAVVYLFFSVLLILYVLISLTSIMGLSVWIWSIIHLLIILFWTFILNSVCFYGYEWVSWVLVLFPLFVVLFSILTGAY